MSKLGLLVCLLPGFYLFLNGLVITKLCICLLVFHLYLLPPQVENKVDASSDTNFSMEYIS